MTVHVDIDPAVSGLRVGLVEARDLTITPSDDQLAQLCRTWVGQVIRDGPEGGDARREAVRRLLRRGGFKPSGRNKPAQEYLLRAAHENAWPAISNAVDVLNGVSLRSGLPISLLSLTRVGTRLLIRYGRPGEQYVFNPSGQALNVEGLICVCQHRGDGATEPVGSPVKDSQYGKVMPEDAHLLACLFAPQESVTAEVLTVWCNELSHGLRQWCRAQDVRVAVVPP